MAKLHYRGQTYFQYQRSKRKDFIKLAYKTTKNETQYPTSDTQLNYRGVKYKSKKAVLKKRFYSQRNKVLKLASELVTAQFFLADNELCSRLWEEANSLDIDPQRIINLMYRDSLAEDYEDLIEADYRYLKSH